MTGRLEPSLQCRTTLHALRRPKEMACGWISQGWTISSVPHHPHAQVGSGEFIAIPPPPAAGEAGLLGRLSVTVLVRDPTACTILQQDGPYHLGQW